MLQVVPSFDNPIYLEWKKWWYRANENYTTENQEAKDSIVKIAKFVYDGQCHNIIGHMIYMKDLEEIEAENAKS